MCIKQLRIVIDVATAFWARKLFKTFMIKKRPPEGRKINIRKIKAKTDIETKFWLA